MKYKIRYRTYDECGLVDGFSMIEAQSFVFENGFVGIWTEFNNTQNPDLYINIDDVFTIETL